MPWICKKEKCGCEDGFKDSLLLLRSRRQLSLLDNIVMLFMFINGCSKSKGILCSLYPIGDIHDISNRIKLQIQIWMSRDSKALDRSSVFRQEDYLQIFWTEIRMFLQKRVGLQHHHANMQLLWPGFLCVSEISIIHNTCLHKKCWQENQEVSGKKHRLAQISALQKPKELWASNSPAKTHLAWPYPVRRLRKTDGAEQKTRSLILDLLIQH